MKTILVIEDDGGVRRMLWRFLESEGHRVVEAQSGREGLETLQYDSPDLILLDFNLPGLKGDEVCRRLRRVHATRGVPILAITGEMGTKAELDLLESGADDCLPKPFDLLELRARVSALLRRCEAAA